MCLTALTTLSGTTLSQTFVSLFWGLSGPYSPIVHLGGKHVILMDPSVCKCVCVLMCAKGPASPLYKQSHLPGLSRSQSDAGQEWNAFQSFFTTKSLAWPELCVGFGAWLGFSSTIFLPSVFPHLFVKLNTHIHTTIYAQKEDLKVQWMEWWDI